MNKATIALLITLSVIGTSQASANEKSASEVKADLSGFNFGAAIGFETYDEPYINDAELIGDDRIVTVTDSTEHNTTLWLETHYVWTALNWWDFEYTYPGFYVGARAVGKESEIFDAFSLGLMLAFARTNKGATVESINIGVGPVWHRTKRLADGIENGAALPDNFSDIQYVKEDEVTWMLMISAGFQL